MENSANDSNLSVNASQDVPEDQVSTEDVANAEVKEVELGDEAAAPETESSSPLSLHEELEKQSTVDDQGTTVSSWAESQKDSDSRSIYIGNVDYLVNAEELQRHFEDCGAVMRVTIPTNDITQHPRGFAYMEFKAKESAERALAKNLTVLKGRALKVQLKRTNIPGYNARNHHNTRYSYGGNRYAPY